MTRPFGCDACQWRRSGRCRLAERLGHGFVLLDRTAAVRTARIGDLDRHQGPNAEVDNGLALIGDRAKRLRHTCQRLNRAQPTHAGSAEMTVPGRSRDAFLPGGCGIASCSSTTFDPAGATPASIRRETRDEDVAVSIACRSHAQSRVRSWAVWLSSVCTTAARSSSPAKRCATTVRATVRIFSTAHCPVSSPAAWPKLAVIHHDDDDAAGSCVVRRG